MRLRFTTASQVFEAFPKAREHIEQKPAEVPPLVFVQLLQEIYNGIVGQPFTMGILLNGYFLAGSALLVLTGSFLSGSYVALVLSSFNPVATIRGKFASGTGGLLLRKGLVVFQLAVSIIFLNSTLVL